ncbi:MAG: hypothetical protein IKQ56_09415 [Lachnospiraceae bacterium]|nr:hypothetical protein [Lachnospiraceae bacterium]
MRWIAKLEKKIGKYAIPNLIVYLLVGYVVGYLLFFITPLREILYLFQLQPAYVLNGQVWRLFTWILVPPSFTNVFFYAIMIFFYYQLGTVLERMWGAFRFNLYIFGGILITDIAVMVGFFVLASLGSPETAFIGQYVSTYYINLAIFLAYAMTFPENKVFIYFIIPVKMKWLAIIYGALIVVDFFQVGWGGRIVIIASLLNFLIYMALTGLAPSRAQVKRQQEFRRSVNEGHKKVTPVGVRHKCCICGRTNLSDPNLEFRYCSRCMGNYEYCSEHLFTHQHVR